VDFSLLLLKEASKQREVLDQHLKVNKANVGKAVSKEDLKVVLL
jgi:hypothetical protein